MIRVTHVASVFLLLSYGLSSISCGGRAAGNVSTASANANSTTANANGAKTDVEELRLIINIPYEAEDIFWKEDKVQKKLTAVLRFDRADTDKLNADLEKAAAAVTAEIEAEDWFPDELRSQSEMKGDTALTGKTYSASQFFSEAYTGGKITRVAGTDFFVLELTGK